MSEAMNARVSTAIERACRFLVAGQAQDGFWRDYALPPGPSSEWVTAFVGYALSGAGSASAYDEPLGHALSALRSSCRPSGWGYNAAVATDADTTSWAVRLFVRANTEPPLEPVSCLEAYVGPEGGGARTFACGPRYGRWTMQHVDVTAVLGLAMKEAGGPVSEVQRLRRWLLEQRNADGLWTSFWWTIDAYASARALEFLAGTGGIPDDVAEAARHYLQGRKDSASVMETANLLMMASWVGACPDAWLLSLLSRQRSIGGWPPSCVLRVPSQMATPGADAEFEDLNGLMSTATAVMALTEFLRIHRHDA